MKLFQYVQITTDEMQQKTKEQHSNIDMKNYYCTYLNNISGYYFCSKLAAPVSTATMLLEPFH